MDRSKNRGVEKHAPHFRIGIVAFNPIDEFARSDGAVADAVFHIDAELSESLVITVGAENGVVAEAVGADSCGGDFAVDTAFKLMKFAV